MLVDSMLTTWARQVPDRLALAVPAGPRLSYASLEHLVCSAATEWAGHDQCVPIPIQETDALAYLLRFLGVVRAGCVALCQPGVASPQQPVAERWRITLPPGHGPVPAEEKLFYMGVTSGSTGEPKAVLRTQRSWVASFALMTRLFGQPQRVAVPGSLSYSAALIAALHTLHEGGSLWLLPTLAGHDMLDLLEQEYITATFLVPARLRALLAALGDRRSALPLTITTAGAKLDAATRTGIARVFPAGQLFEYYGSVEMGFVTYMDPEAGHLRPDSVGRLCPGVECLLRDAQGTPVAPGQPGIISVHSPYQFAGYAPDGRGLVAGWVSAGDWGQFDSEGFLVLLGREDEQINTGGAKVFPASIEAGLRAHPAVADVAVLGLPDARRGQVVGAVIVLQPGQSLTSTALRRWCQRRLPSGGVPRRIVFTSHLPCTHAGKVDRQVVAHLLGVTQ